MWVYYFEKKGHELLSLLFFVHLWDFLGHQSVLQKELSLKGLDHDSFKFYTLKLG